MEDGAAARKRLEDMRAIRRKKAAGQLGQATSNGMGPSPDPTTSKYFTNGSGSGSKVVLVPDSSPMNSPEEKSKTYKPHAGYGIPHQPPAVASSDAALIPSNFIHRKSLSSNLNAMSSSSLYRSHSATSDASDRPTKRANTGTSTPTELSVFGSSPAPTPPNLASPEDSPEVTRIRRKPPGKRANRVTSDDDDDSEEDMPDVSEIGKQPRKLVRRPKNDSLEESGIIEIMSSPNPLGIRDPTPLERLREIAPSMQDAQLKILLHEAHNNIEDAEKLLRQQVDAHRFYSKAIPSSSKPPAPWNQSMQQHAGPSRPLAATNQSEALSSKQMGKMSTIYAKRPAIQQSRDDFSNPSTPAIPEASTSRRVIKRKRRPADSDEGSAVETDASMRGKGKGKERTNHGSGSSASGGESDQDSEEEAVRQVRMTKGVEFFNEATEEQIIEVTACTPIQAKRIISIRPFKDIDELRSRFGKAKSISFKLFDVYLSVVKGYDTLDQLFIDCEKFGEVITKVIKKWTGAGTPNESITEAAHANAIEAATATGDDPPIEDEGIHLTKVAVDISVVKDDPDLADFIREQPSLMNPEVVLKDYQLLGVNWLNLLYKKRKSCILADEMGLGKTIQVIGFFAHLKDINDNAQPPDRYLIIVPPSTLENWTREFERFAPILDVQTYYGSQNDRAQQRVDLGRSKTWEVLLTTYNLAQNDVDRKFLAKIEWKVCVFDEGHMLKNFQSQRYQSLLKIPARWRLLLTGTPLQNNLQELVSLMNFIIPGMIGDHEEALRAIFKAKADSSLSFLSRDRVSRAKKMMTPFVLRRRKAQVLKDLPQKTERIEFCEMTSLQRKIYNDALQRSRKVLDALKEENPQLVQEKPKKKPGVRSRLGKLTGDTSSNVLMDLRKAALHPMLFRRLFDDDKIKVMAKHCLKEPEFCQSNYQFVVEDMEVMTDAELQAFCKRYPSVRKHALDDSSFLAAGKIETLLRLLERYKSEDKRVLIFSQFVQVLDILQAIFKNKNIKYLVLTGSTAVDVRQGLVDQFTEDTSIPAFLLSTKAGGMGINLTAASVVIMFDQDFNPHNDKQACDRAYRIGQTRDVEVIKLITRNSIEEDIHQIGKTKLMLDDAVAGDQEEGGGEAAENVMKSSLITLLRSKFEETGPVSSAELQENANGPSISPPSSNVAASSTVDVIDVDAPSPPATDVSMRGSSPTPKP